MKKRFLSTLPLAKESVRLPIVLVSWIGFGIALYGIGVFQEIGKLIVGMWLGMLIFGWLLDVSYLNEQGIKQGFRLTTIEHTNDNNRHAWENYLKVRAETIDFLIADGLSDQEIAKALTVEEKQVLAIKTRDRTTDHARQGVK